MDQTEITPGIREYVNQATTLFQQGNYQASRRILKKLRQMGIPKDLDLEVAHFLRRLKVDPVPFLLGGLGLILWLLAYFLTHRL